MQKYSPDIPTTDDQVRECMRGFWDGLRPPPVLTVSEWSDTNRTLPRSSSSEPGQWRTSRTPYLREIMDCMSPSSPYEQVVVMKGSQLGYTEALMNVQLFHISHAPCPSLLVQPTIDMAKKFVRQRLATSIRECECLRGKIKDSKSRDGGNSMLQKDFPGGTLIIAGANSASGLRSMPIQLLLMDEVDAYPEDVDGEGDPCDLAQRRTTNFARRKILKGSTPTTADVSRIAREFETSDQRYYYVPCPACGEMQIIRWENIKFADRDPGTVYLRCVKCDHHINERYKTQMLERGEWRAHKPGSPIAGFHISALYSPLGWYSWSEAVDDHLKAMGNPLKRKVFVNTVLAEVWEETASTIDVHQLAKKKEPYPAEVPAGALVLTCGVDTQDDRLECHVVGWGLRGESWVIDYTVIYGDPHQRLGVPGSVWAKLDQYRARRWKHENGSTMMCAGTGVDSRGHCTDEVYDYCARRESQHVWVMVGRHGPGRQLIMKATKSARAKTYLFNIGTDQAKGVIYSRLKSTEKMGPGVIHFPKLLPIGADGEGRELTDAYFQGLTAERRVTERHGGLPVFRWVLPAGKRNEPLDTMVYAMAALQILNPNLELLASENRIMNTERQRPPQPGRRVLNPGVRV